MNDQERDTLLKRVDDNVTEIKIWKSALDVRCEGHRKDTNGLRETLYGNPHGVVKQVNMLVNCKTNISRRRDFWIFVLRGVLTAGIIGLAAWLLSVFKLIQFVRPM